MLILIEITPSWWDRNQSFFQRSWWKLEQALMMTRSGSMTTMFVVLALTESCDIKSLPHRNEFNSLICFPFTAFYSLCSGSQENGRSDRVTIPFSGVWWWFLPSSTAKTGREEGESAFKSENNEGIKRNLFRLDKLSMRPFASFTLFAYRMPCECRGSQLTVNIKCTQYSSSKRELSFE